MNLPKHRLYKFYFEKIKITFYSYVIVYKMWKKDNYDPICVLNISEILTYYVNISLYHEESFLSRFINNSRINIMHAYDTRRIEPVVGLFRALFRQRVQYPGDRGGE